MEFSKKMKDGVKKLFIGETSLAICYGLTVVAMIIMIFMSDTFKDAESFVTADISSTYLLYVADILQIIAAVIILIAYASMIKEESLFKKAMGFFVLSVIASLVSNIFSVGFILLTIAEAAKIIFTTLSVVCGTKGLAKLTDNKEAIAICKGVAIYTCPISIILLVISTIMVLVGDYVIMSIFIDMVILVINAVVSGVYAKTIKKIK